MIYELIPWLKRFGRILDGSTLTIYFVILFATILLFWKVIKRTVHDSVYHPKVVFLGQSGSGKTALFFLLRNGKVPETISSIKETVDSFPLPGKETTAQFIDFPGHQRMRELVKQHLQQVTCIIYMVDSTDKQCIRLAAEHIFWLLSSGHLTKPSCMKICCNKNDLENARTVDTIKNDMEREIELLRHSRTAALEEEDEKTISFCETNLPFEFDNIHVGFVTCSVKSNEISDIVSFISKFVR